MMQKASSRNFIDKFRLFWISFLLLIFGMFCTKNLVHAASFSNVKIDKLTYDLDESTQTATVKKYNPGLWDKLSGSYDITIPETVKYKNKKYNVTKVEGGQWNGGAFSGDKKIKKVTGNSIKDINSDSFYNCENLKEISFPKATYIGGWAFENCSKLEKVNLPEATNINYSAFRNCKNLKTISLPKATYIGSCAFQNCSKLEKASLPEAINIDYCAFSDCTSLTTISLSKATYIGDYAFYYCNKLATISIPEVTRIGYGAFGKTNLETIYLPKVTYIENRAFQSLGNLKSASIPNVIRIDSEAFYGCNQLSSVLSPKATYIGEGAFQGCSKLESMSLPNATYIGDYAFDGNKNLSSIELPKATYIGTRAFSSCDALTKLYAPNLVYHGNYIFSYTNNDKTFDLPKILKNLNLELSTNSAQKIDKNYINNEPNIEALVDKDNLDAKIREVKNNLSAKYNNLTIYSEKLGDYKSDQYKNSRYYAVRFYPANRKDGVENNFTDKVLLLLAADININVPNTQFLYDKKAHKTDIIAKDGEYILQEGTDYNLKYDENLVDVGTKSVTLEFIGDYAGLESKTCTYEVIADRSDWGTRVLNNGVVNYVDASGKTSAEVTGNEMIWLKETSDGTSAWYAVNNSDGTFKQGSRFWVKWLSPESNKEEFEEYYNKLDEEHKKRIEKNKLWIFLTGVTDPDGNEYKNLGGKTVDYYIQIGEDWDKRDIKAIFIDEYSDSVLEVSYENLKFPEGNTEFAKLAMEHFSPYAVMDQESIGSDNYVNGYNDKGYAKNSENTSSERSVAGEKTSSKNVRSGLVPKISIFSLIILISISSAVIFNKFKFKRSE